MRARLLVVALAAACGAPPTSASPPAAPDAPDPSPRPAPTHAAARQREHREVAVGDYHHVRLAEGAEMTFVDGELVVALNRSPSSIFLVGMAPGTATLLISGGGGPELDLTVAVVAGRTPCREVTVPVLGLSAVEEKRVRMFRDASNGAGELHVMGTSNAITFERPGALLLQTEDHDGVSRCTYFVARGPLACRESLTVRVGESVTVSLHRSASSVLLTGKNASDIRHSPDGRSFTVTGKKEGSSALWSDPSGAWRCTTVAVTP